MSTPEAVAPTIDLSRVSLEHVERELARCFAGAAAEGDIPSHRARMSNLVVFCDHPDRVRAVEQAVPDIVAVHPARVLLLVVSPEDHKEDLHASINVWCRQLEHGYTVCSEQITLTADRRTAYRLPFAMRSLLVSDLPTNLWWAAGASPAVGGSTFYDLAEYAEQIIYDSIGWMEPAREVVATGSWLPQIERQSATGMRRVASDLNWRRLKSWRRALAQCLDPNSAPGAIESINDVRIEHGPHAVVQAWQLASWLAARLGWRVQKGNIRPGVEISWQLNAPHGALRLHICRLSEGPAEVRKVQITCNAAGKATGWAISFSDDVHLSIVPDGDQSSARTVAATRPGMAELVGKQLSDRERDPVFNESMAIAKVFAQSVS